MNNIKIAYVVGAPFPTKKAYGVTSRETINVLVRNQISTKIFCLPGNHTDSDYNMVSELISVFTQSLISKKFIFYGSLGSSRLYFALWRIGIAKIVIENFKKITDFKPDYIWLRDPLIAYLYLKKFKSIKIILEVHEKSGKYFLKNLVKFNTRICYFPITKENEDYLRNLNPKANSSIAPMAIRAENIAKKEECIDFADFLRTKSFKNLKIGYVGKIAPNNYSKGTEDLIELAKYSKQRKLDLSVSLIGVMGPELSMLEKLRRELKIEESKLNFKVHVTHSQALTLMKDFDVLVLPAYSSNNYTGMPLKLLEYLSTGKITIVADVPLYNQVFLKDFQPFYYTPGDPESLYDSICSAVRLKDLDKHLVAGVEFAANFTWDNRTLNMLSAVDSL